MAASRLVIDSRLRDSGTVEDYVYTLKSPLRNVVGVSLQSCILPKSSYNVITGYNDTFDYYEAAGDQTIVLDPGVYTASSLIAVFNTEFSNVNANISVALVMGRFEITNALGGPADLFIKEQTTTPAMAQLIGWTGGLTVVTAGGAAVTAAALVNVSWPLYLLLDIDFGSNQSFGSATWTKEGTYTMVIPYGTANNLEFENYTRDDDFPQGTRVTDVNVQEIRVRLRPPDSAADDEAPPANWSLYGVDHLIVLNVVQNF